MKLTKQKMIDHIVNEIVQCGDCECDDGKSCSFCFALILHGMHAEWKWSESKKKFIKRKGK